MNCEIGGYANLDGIQYLRKRSLLFSVKSGHRDQQHSQQCPLNMKLHEASIAHHKDWKQGEALRL